MTEGGEIKRIYEEEFKTGLRVLARQCYPTLRPPFVATVINGAVQAGLIQDKHLRESALNVDSLFIGAQKRDAIPLATLFPTQFQSSIGHVIRREEDLCFLRKEMGIRIIRMNLECEPHFDRAHPDQKRIMFRFGTDAMDLVTALRTKIGID